MVTAAYVGNSREVGKNNVGGVMTEGFLEDERFQLGIKKNN